ncbi:vWA domain-containing protein [Sulfurimonas sp.]|uniref:vWA domain-containing protein n=1 Tax=Sulfurimonas sp. TaxID=2022749 RepID=UPI003D11E428
MSSFTFEYPFALVLLLLIICIYKCPASVKKIIFPHLNLFTSHTSWLSKEKLFYSFILALLITALSSPISYKQNTSHYKKGRDIVFALDTSGSMAENNKLGVLKDVIRDFISKRFDDNVGVSVFGSYAFSAIPLTYDMQSINFLLDFFDVGIAGDSTAIGDGLYSAIAILDQGDAKRKVIVLVTDGLNNSGSFSIKDVVTIAKNKHILIYTIGIGKSSEFDAELLKKIAKKTRAKSYQSANIEELATIYDELDTLEPSDLPSQHYLNKKMLYIYPLILASFLIGYLVYTANQRREF